MASTSSGDICPLEIPDNVNDVTDPVIVGGADGIDVNGVREGNVLGLRVGDDVTNTFSTVAL
jgi:hypothetical protein